MNMDDMSDLPEEVLREIAKHTPEDKIEKLAKIGMALASKRQEAVTERKGSGIESIWMECEESYLGMDDSNRHEFEGAKWAKPTSMDGPVTARRSVGNEIKSSAFVRMTSRYVDAGTAKICEIILPIDGKSFSIESTPIPELIKGKEDLRQIVHEATGQPLMKPAAPQLPAPPAQPAMPGMPPAEEQPQGPQPLTVKDIADEQSDLAYESAQKAEKRIFDWMVESNYHGEMRKVLFDAARIGTGILKGPIPIQRKTKSMSRGDDGIIALQIVDEIVPSIKWVDPWNIYPHAACGENIHNGDYIFERDYLSPKKLSELKGDPGYLADQIDLAIEEGPGKCFTDSGNPNDKLNKFRFEVWYYYGILSTEDLAVINEKAAKDMADRKDVFVIVTMVNDRVIKAVINPLDSGSFPYHAFPWTRRTNSWTGVGISEQIRLPQRMCNASTRAMLNNAGMSSGIQLVIDRNGITPADTQWTITPNKIWFKSSDSIIDDVRKAFHAVEFPNTQPQLMAINQYSFKLAEESCNIPLISQGFSGDATPETYGGQVLQNNNANQLLRGIGYTVDDYITKPLIQDFYEWLLLDPAVPDDEKGDFHIQANGSAALVERAIQNHEIEQMAQLVMNPAFGINPKKWVEQLMKSKRINPKDFQYSEEEQKKMDAQPPQPPIPLAVAQIRAQTDEKIAQLENQTQQQRIKVDTDRDTVYVQAETERTQNENAVRMAELQAKERLEMLKYATQQKISLEQVKAELANTAMKLNVQKELSAAALQLDSDKEVARHTVDLHKHRNPVMTPPTEPAGRAEPGQGFSQ